VNGNLCADIDEPWKARVGHRNAAHGSAAGPRACRSNGKGLQRRISGWFLCETQSRVDLRSCLRPYRSVKRVSVMGVQ
jgi:hypothetical protein